MGRREAGVLVYLLASSVNVGRLGRPAEVLSGALPPRWREAKVAARARQKYEVGTRIELGTCRPLKGMPEGVGIDVVQSDKETCPLLVDRLQLAGLQRAHRDVSLVRRLGCQDVDEQRAFVEPLELYLARIPVLHSRNGAHLRQDTPAGDAHAERCTSAHVGQDNRELLVLISDKWRLLKIDPRCLDLSGLGEFEGAARIARLLVGFAEQPIREARIDADREERQDEYGEREPIKGIAAGLLALALTVAGLWRATFTALECRTRWLTAWAVVSGIVVTLVGQGFVWLALFFLCPVLR